VIVGATNVPCRHAHRPYNRGPSAASGPATRPVPLNNCQVNYDIPNITADPDIRAPHTPRRTRAPAVMPAGMATVYSAIRRSSTGM
jgi:hypothetical protein